LRIKGSEIKRKMLNNTLYSSPNYDTRPPGAKPDMVIIHYTDMLSADEALARLCDSEAKVSAHFLIHKTGELFQLVEPMYRAWHAGVSSWEGVENVNSRSIGIELDNGGHTFGPEPFPHVQIETLVQLLSKLTKDYQIQPHRILGHSDVAPLRKTDPGELFPWDVLASKGFGLWPSFQNSAMNQSPMTVEDIQKALEDIGYSCCKTGIWDEETQKICRAFQQHFTPRELTGHPSFETHKMLQGILRTLGRCA
jgi:N-acetylmuramoyl-L-alanine amidase